jgi:hypothetical protein
MSDIDSQNPCGATSMAAPEYALMVYLSKLSDYTGADIDPEGCKAHGSVVYRDITVGYWVSGNHEQCARGYVLLGDGSNQIPQRVRSALKTTVVKKEQTPGILLADFSAPDWDWFYRVRHVNRRPDPATAGKPAHIITGSNS